MIYNVIQKYKEMSIQARASIWFVMCSILQKGISFITVPIFTRLLSAEQYGTYSLYLSWLQIITILTSLNVFYGVFNNGMVKFENDRDRFISAMQGLTVTITGIYLVIAAIFQNFWSQLLGLSPILIFLMFIEMLVTPALSFWSGKQRFQYKYQKLVLVTLLKSVANPVLGIIAVLAFEDKVMARIASVAIIEVLFCGIVMFLQFKKGKCFYHKSYWKYAVVLAIPLLPHYLSSMLLNQGDRIMISKMIGNSEVAFYSVAYNIGMLVQIFTSAINNSFTPWVYQKISGNNYKGIKTTVNSLLLLVSALALCLMMMSPELVMVFGSSEYAGAAYAIPPVAASVFFIFLYNILAIPQFYFERTHFLMISSIGAAIVNIGLNYIFITLFGYIAAGYTTLVCYVIYSLGHYFISQKITKRSIPKAKLFDGKFILILSVLTILFGISCNILFDFWYIRYSLLFSCGIVLFIKRDKAFLLLKGIKK